ncbi:energy transducer TonB [Flavobacterium sp.]|uniref:energy transducer TonB n=1 Tax=Flavobacterium sp. TaxID=239 RepID=UPI00286C112C|nr:energy transducer TonB [Flavobacterium sp.]
MKSILFAILFLFIPKLCFSQTSAIDRKIYLDSTSNETTSENYKYYRIIKDFYSDKDFYLIKDYYKSGVLQMEGTSKTKDANSKEGEFVFYYENGNKKAVTNYLKSRPIGKNSEWYENGNKKLEGEYIENEKTFVGVLKVFQFWNSKNVQTVLDGNGDLEEISEFFFASGKVKNGFKDGNWEGYDKKIGYTFSEIYENQKLFSGVSVDSNKVSRTYKMVEVRPEPKKGYTDFYKHVGKNFRTPDIKGLQGKIIIGFTIDKNGSIIKPKILKSIGYGTDEEAIKVVTTYKDFAPGEIRGIKVSCAFTLPISIQSAN